MSLPTHYPSDLPEPVDGPGEREGTADWHSPAFAEEFATLAVQDFFVDDPAWTALTTALDQPAVDMPRLAALLRGPSIFDD